MTDVARRDDRPTPVPANVVPDPSIAAMLYPIAAPRRDIEAELIAAAGLLSEIVAPLVRRLREFYPDPVPCAVCGMDMVRLDGRSRAAHWDTHGWVDRALARLRVTR